MKDVSIFVGLDVHKDSIDVALVEEDRNATVRFYGTVGGDLTDLGKPGTLPGFSVDICLNREIREVSRISLAFPSRLQPLPLAWESVHCREGFVPTWMHHDSTPP